METLSKQAVTISSAGPIIEGSLDLPEHARGIVLFAHGSGSSRLSPRNNYVAGVLHQLSIGTLLIDLLTQQEDADYRRRFDIALLAERLRCAAQWLLEDEATRKLPLGLFGASTGAAAALQLGASLQGDVAAIVSRGGRADLAGQAALSQVRAPTLLIVGGNDSVVIDLNQAAYAEMQCEKHLEIVPGAGHLFEEPEKLDMVAAHAAAWFGRYLV